MFKHLFKLIWNKKKQNFLLMSEMLISFLVIFAVFTLMVYYVNNYKKPMGLDYENVWVINYNNSYQTKNTDSLNQFYETLRRSIKALPQVEELSFCSDNTPFSQNTWQGGMTYKGKKISHINEYRVEDSYKKTLNIQVLEGRWFDKSDAAAKNEHIIISDEMRRELFGTAPAVGQLIGDDGDKKKMLQIIGVVQGVKQKGDYLAAGNEQFGRLDTGAFHWVGKILLKVRPDADAAFEGKLYKTVAGFLKNSNVEIEHLKEKRVHVNYFNVIPMIVLGVVSCFLIINVALGLFGVLWYNINKRRGEIGLRRAIGATGNAVSSQLIGESMVLATLALIVGTFFAIQFPLLNVFDLEAGIYIVALILAIIFIYVLVLICSLYPGKQAAAIYPAVALHEE